MMGFFLWSHLIFDNQCISWLCFTCTVLSFFMQVIKNPGEFCNAHYTEFILFGCWLSFTMRHFSHSQFCHSYQVFEVFSSLDYNIVAESVANFVLWRPDAVSVLCLFTTGEIYLSLWGHQCHVWKLFYLSTLGFSLSGIYWLTSGTGKNFWSFFITLIIFLGFLTFIFA